MRLELRFILALWLGKVVYRVSRFLGRNGTTLPGAVTLKFYPEMTYRAAARISGGSIVVTGTNGKTTTSNMLAEILTASGYKITYNKAGANLNTGVTTALINSLNWIGKPKADLALLEVDEAAFVKVAPAVMPHTVLVTNFFRDQLDRYGELDMTIALVKNTLDDYLPQARVILNADDPLVAMIGSGREDVLYFGVSTNEYSSTESSQAREAKFCACGHAYEYELFHYGQLGIYRCPGCGYTRPTPEFSAGNVRMQGVLGSSFELVYPEPGHCGHCQCQIKIQPQGLYNVYNALAAAAAGISIGIGTDIISTSLGDFSPRAGRMEQFDLGICSVTLSLVKNPTGFNEVIRAMVSGGKKMGLIIAINDNAADGRDISWLWDVDFEVLVGRVDFVVCSGIRAEEMAVRLKYAGIEPDKLKIIKELGGAVAWLTEEKRVEQEIYVLPTYTALFPLRSLLGSIRSKAYAS